MDSEIVNDQRKAIGEFYSNTELYCDSLNKAEDSRIKEKERNDNEALKEASAINDSIQEFRSKLIQHKILVEKSTKNVDWSPNILGDITEKENQSLKESYYQSIDQANRKAGLLDYCIGQYDRYLLLQKKEKTERESRNAIIIIAVIVILVIGVVIVGGVISSQQNLKATQTEMTQQIKMGSLIGSPTNSIISMNIPANVEWTNTNISVLMGDEIHIKAQGQWKNDPGYSLYDANGYTGSGDPNAVLPTANVGALIGKIGDCQPFLVGNELTFNASCTGILSLGMNDSLYGYDNNVGEVSSQIEINPSIQPQQMNIPSLQSTQQVLVPSPQPMEESSSQSPAPFPTMDFSCPGAPPIRVELGDLVRVTTTDGDKLSLRSSPNGSHNIIDYISEGMELRVIGEHVCSENFTYWKIQIWGTTETGWVREGDYSLYYIEPIY